MVVEINNPAETIREEIETWVAKVPDAKDRLSYARQQVGLVWYKSVLEVLEEKLQGKGNLSEKAVAEAAIMLESVIQMGDLLTRRQTRIADIGNVFADVLIKRENFREDPVAVQTYRRVASAVLQLSSE